MGTLTHGNNNVQGSNNGGVVRSAPAQAWLRFTATVREGDVVKGSVELHRKIKLVRGDVKDSELVALLSRNAGKVELTYEMDLVEEREEADYSF